jgi:23S rRNA (uracil1939-C5)-methyltransferase
MRIAIERLGHLGDGIGAGPDGGPVYAARALPGEVIEGEAEDGRIEAPRIVTPSPDRVAARCPHYRSCGGCALMHASDGFVAGWKTRVIETALAAQGLKAPIRAMATSPPRSRRRATLAGRRTKKGALVGFHARRSDTIVPISECHVLDPGLDRPPAHPAGPRADRRLKGRGPVIRPDSGRQRGGPPRERRQTAERSDARRAGVLRGASSAADMGG